jgi:hypothetical protein
VKEGAARDPRNDYGEDEELHVLITGDKQTDVRGPSCFERLVCNWAVLNCSSRSTAAVGACSWEDTGMLQSRVVYGGVAQRQAPLVARQSVLWFAGGAFLGFCMK